jgi:hypothetical protein
MIRYRWPLSISGIDGQQVPICPPANIVPAQVVPQLEGTGFAFCDLPKKGESLSVPPASYVHSVLAFTNDIYEIDYGV